MVSPRLRTSNFGISQLVSAIGSGDSSFDVVAGEGTLFPTGNFRIVIEEEVIHVGARAGDTLSSLTRGAEGSTAAAHGSGVTVDHPHTAGMNDRIFDRDSYVLVASDDTETPFTSSTNADLKVFSNIGTIPASRGIYMTFLTRKTAGEAAIAQLGLRLNATNYDASGGSLTPTALFSGTNNNRIEQAFVRLWIPPRRANYLRLAQVQAFLTDTVSFVNELPLQRPIHDTDLITADITEIAIRGRMSGGTGAATGYLRDVRIHVVEQVL